MQIVESAMHAIILCHSLIVRYTGVSWETNKALTVVGEAVVEATEPLHGLLHLALHAPEKNRTLASLLRCVFRNYSGISLDLQAPAIPGMGPKRGISA